MLSTQLDHDALVIDKLQDGPYYALFVDAAVSWMLSKMEVLLCFGAYQVQPKMDVIMPWSWMPLVIKFRRWTSFSG